MTQNDLNRAVARATGETVTEIRRLGFQPLDIEPADPEDRIIDWDTLELERSVALYEQRPSPQMCIAAPCELSQQGGGRQDEPVILQMPDAEQEPVLSARQLLAMDA